MSAAEAPARPAPAASGSTHRPARVSTRFLRSEVRLVFRRRRNQGALVVLALYVGFVVVLDRTDSDDALGAGLLFFLIVAVLIFGIGGGVSFYEASCTSGGLCRCRTRSGTTWSWRRPPASRARAS